ncbi:MAG: aminoacyl-tRNA hydrolase [bacterium]|nr:aminoacyl-tRNA hydrolase [bacterium]
MDIEQILNTLIKKEVYFHFSNAHGHGGQNINKRKTKAELYFNVRDSHLLSEEQKDLIVEKSGHRIHHHEHILIFTCQEERYQKANKIKVIHHFKEFLRTILIKPKERIATQVPVHEKEKRLFHKKRHSEKKERRRMRHHRED